MQFEEAYKELLKGKKISRKEWNQYTFIVIEKDEVKSCHGVLKYFHDKPSFLIYDDWIEIGGNGRLLTFPEAFECLKQGKKITRKEWKNKHLFIADNQFVLCEMAENDFSPTYQCLMANDWEVIE